MLQPHVLTNDLNIHRAPIGKSFNRLSVPPLLSGLPILHLVKSMAILAPIFSAAHVAQWEALDNVAQSTVTRYNSNDSGTDQFPRVPDESTKTNWTRWYDTDGAHVMPASAASDGAFSEAGVPVRSEFGVRGVVAVAVRREQDYNILVKQPRELSHGEIRHKPFPQSDSRATLPV
ncbi:hypothetical protein BDN67DRAFT_969517 [Paxillus ammoniavirescens]|nr:hypothetical protein BDN67DRAFT_969517 [Paxillus ammoniavirescens]